MRHSDKAKPSVLVVDDEPQITVALADLLDDNFRVLISNSGEAALEALKADERISVILSDQRMPGMTGDELFKHAREISPAARILITAYADISAVIDAVNNGKIYAYVTKPWQSDQLVMTVTRAADYCNLHQEILQEQALLHQLMENSIDAIAIKDTQHRFVRANTQAAKMFGFRGVDELESCLRSDCLPADRSSEWRDRDASVLETGTPLRDCIDEVTSANGSKIWYSSNISPIRNAQGEITGLVCVTRDVTEGRRIEIMKDEFIATVNHELRTPLTVIQGSLNLLTKELSGKIGEAPRKLLDIGRSNCKRLFNLVTDLLDTLSLDKGEMVFEHSDVDIHDLICAAADRYVALAEEKDIRLAIPPASLNAAIKGDRERLLQALGKIIENAIAFTPRGGEVKIWGEHVPDDVVRLNVVDEGPGVPEDARSRIFARFGQSDSSSRREKNGTGLGLYIAASIVDAHSGRIDFENEAGKGARFYIELPAAGATVDG